jgi:tetratricopeptide (TPR) repeat protein
MKRKTVSLCMIARDEEACIGKAIKSALALVDEIVVVDTGSRDNTRIIAEGYGARIVDEVWHDDFASVRNAALAAAACDWVLMLDCDEQLQSIRPVDFQRLLIDPGVIGYRLQLAEAGEGDRLDTRPVLRLFRNEPRVRYRYPVLEQVEPSLAALAQDTGQAVVDSPLLLLHDPGNPDQRSRKRDRNLRLLREALAASPEEPYFAHQLARETLHVLDGEVLPVAGLRRNLDHLARAWRHVAGLSPEERGLVTYGPALAADYAAALLAVGDAGRAAAATESALDWWRDAGPLRLQAARAALARLEAAAPDDRAGRTSLAADVRRHLLAIDHAALAANAVDARLLLLSRLRLEGELALAENRVSDASEAFEHALDHDQAYAAAWVGLADCARRAGDRKRALRLYLRAVTASEWSLQAWTRGCHLLDELGFHDNATSWREKVQQQFPEHAPVAVPAI